MKRRQFLQKVDLYRVKVAPNQQAVDSKMVISRKFVIIGLIGDIFTHFITIVTKIRRRLTSSWRMSRGALIGIEVKASATFHSSDFKGLRKLSGICGDDLKLGVVMYDGTKVVPFGNRLFAAPIACLWA